MNNDCEDKQTNMISAVIKVYGIVQGVGFRPFVHKQVERLLLNGSVRNTSDGAEIEIEGKACHVRQFIEQLRSNAPKLALIEKVEVEFFKELKGYSEFKIAESRKPDAPNTLISPDICICDDCLAELFDIGNRRYKYPFVHCTNCGPRFTIIKSVPYDRCNTTMAQFKMCPDCSREYKDIENRRYHAEPNCCPDCGPEVFFVGENAAGNADFLKSAHSEEFADSHSAASNEKNVLALETAKKYLEDGKIVAVKGLGGMHLACRCDIPELVNLLRKRKQRDEKPFAVMAKDIETAEKICRINEAEKQELLSCKRPIVLLEKRDKDSLLYISENNYIGVMLPYTPVHYLLFDNAAYDMLIMTSANVSDRPIITKNEEALSELQNIADGFLLNNRDIETACDDSLIWVVKGKEYPVRRSRGYVPYPININYAKKDETGGCGQKDMQILACGSEQKASFALLKGNHVFQSQHMGDLKNAETFENYCAQIKHFEELFSIKPQIVACDLHPDYLSSEYAKDYAEEFTKKQECCGEAWAESLTDSAKKQTTLVKVQHHHAHMASCMADNALNEKCIGIIWDGTGLGTDGTIWGGEFLVGDYASFERAGSIRPFKLPGGDKAAKELSRSAISAVLDAFEGGEDDSKYAAGAVFLNRECAQKENDEDREKKLRDSCSRCDSRWLNESFGFKDGKTNFENSQANRADKITKEDICKLLKIEREKFDQISYMLENGLNCPVCTSMGRLFDAAAAVLGIKSEASYEGQGAILLEAEAVRYEEPLTESFPYNIEKSEDGRYIFDYRPMMRKLVSERIKAGGDLRMHGRRQAVMFLNTLVCMAADIAGLIRKDTGLDAVVLSGGTFQNQYLLRTLSERLEKEGFRVFRHSRVSANDEGIAFGQLAVAAACVKEGE